MTEPVHNVRVRRAIEAFAADPQRRTMLDVVRACLTGQLLLDVTGSELDISEGKLHTGSKLRISSNVGPDGKRALLAFTSNDEIARMHPAGARYQSIAQPAPAVLELAKRQGAGWLYIDPAERTAALSAADIDYALRHPRNDRLSAAIADAEAGRGSRQAVISAFVADGPLLLAGQLAEGQRRDEKPQLRVTQRPDGSTALLAFTSAPEVAARDPKDGIVATTTTKVLEQLQSGPFASIVINPAGPWIELSKTELVAAG
ncbi:SseB family protein [Agrococcus sp. HG114]|uniref:SseB family protein n=1 Tax=Agrococcus sp. HG114 TaxID=2969757 RepID=UPI00215A9978|nr:SseB family protein [Agrococcus sp. HG114]MCR8670577.1 SseB family protein [Agrococcus sp. HG114]